MRRAVARDGPAGVDPHLRSCLRILRAQVIPSILPILLISLIVKVVNQCVESCLCPSLTTKAKASKPSAFGPLRNSQDMIFFFEGQFQGVSGSGFKACKWPSSETHRWHESASLCALCDSEGLTCHSDWASAQTLPVHVAKRLPPSLCSAFFFFFHHFAFLQRRRKKKSVPAQ